jgi:LPS-assembly lipoprotein
VLAPPALAKRAARRALLQRLSALCIAPVAPVALSGCGFALRQVPQFRFRTLALVGFGSRSALALEIRRQLAGSALQVVEAPAQAQVVLEALSDRRDRVVVATTVAGQVREVQLRQRLHFLIRNGDGRELAAPSQLTQTRDLSTNESAVLAKEQEEAQLFESMTSDIAQQVLRRLAALQPGG